MSAKLIQFGTDARAKMLNVRFKKILVKPLWALYEQSATFKGVRIALSPSFITPRKFFWKPTWSRNTKKISPVPTVGLHMPHRTP